MQFFQNGVNQTIIQDQNRILVKAKIEFQFLEQVE